MGIGGAGRLAERRLPPDHPAKAYVEEIRLAADSGAQITRQLLDFSRTTPGPRRLSNIDVVLSALGKLLKRLVHGPCRLSFSWGAPDAGVLADSGDLEQIILNLVTNARDAMPEGGDIHVATRRLDLEEPWPIHAGAVPPGRWVTLSVRDGGVGIGAEVKARMFEPFFTTKDYGKGTGLGLATVHRIIGDLDGFIDVESAPEAGSTFTVYLPARELRGRELTPTVPIAVSAFERSIETLIIDDDALVLESLADDLRRFGLSVTDASNAPDALAAARRMSRLDFVLCDVLMAGVRARDLRDELRRMHPAANVLFMSAFPAQELLQQGHVDRGDPMIMKPFDAAYLIDRMYELLEASRGSSPDDASDRPFILVVEDDDLSRSSIQAVFQQAGFRVEAVGSAEEAMGWFERGTRPTVLVTDMSLPGRSGLEVASCARELWPGLPVLFMSGHPLEGLQFPGPQAFLRKPYLLSTLVGSVRELAKARAV
ncbi:MAG: response regulator [Myxococcales bacterium]|nr:response regulator [Myxococcales bacterium]